MVMSCVLYNFFIIQMKFYERILAAVAALSLIHPDIIFTTFGLAAMIVVFLSQKKRQKSLRLLNSDTII
jgi:TRAP-type uncharacterized transport system fused permease subunit